MQAVILAGGFGTRLSEETEQRPKPMVEIDGKPLLWHIMKSYSLNGITEFIICLGYKGYMIKEFFLNYHLKMSNVEIKLSTGDCKILNSNSEDWKVTLVDTGLNTMTGGRLKRIREHIKNETFCMTYGDGLSNVDIESAIKFHKKHGKLSTVTAVKPLGRFGNLGIDKEDYVTTFKEKTVDSFTWINGGFFVLEPSVLDYVEDDEVSFEDAPLVNLARDNQLKAFFHEGFWQPCDTLRDKKFLESLAAHGKPPWHDLPEK